MKTTEIRAKFLDFFQSHGHECIPSSSLIPGNDPTLLFTNAGMVPFKDLFLGRETRNYIKATSSQRCVRAGGKHNDLENVGYTARHHTFFEMLGNFSFGDYFKREAIHYAWEFLTVEMKLPKEKLWITVFTEDDEAADIWVNDIGVNPARLTRIGAKDNFWSMGDTGPCGPCTEIFYDHGEEVPGGPPGTPEEDGDRYVEIWNLVFMQYDRKANGELVPLPKPSVDTGMGLERLAAVMQHVKSNYDTDLFQNLIKASAKSVDVTDLDNSSLRVIADHIRSCSFLIVDGVVPSNEGRGYVLRRIIRRAARHGFELGQKKPFFYTLVNVLALEMGAAYPELEKAKANIAKILKKEEERFAETLEHGMKILDETIAELDGKIIPGDTVFKLYDTYGFPVDLTADIALSKNLEVDHDGFEKAMEAQRERARAASSFSIDYGDEITVEGDTEFTGYGSTTDESKVVQLFVGNKPVDVLNAGDVGIVILDRTPFYAESGGQAGDTGCLAGNGVTITVNDTQKQSGGVFLHAVQVDSGQVAVGDELKADVSSGARTDIECNHSATHLLHAALREILGDHVHQKGSQVTTDRLRFDFSHPEAVTIEQIKEVEAIVNAQIRRNNAVEANVMNIEEAKSAGAMALFGEKYGSEVRVLRMGEFSIELCGGTHVSRTGNIGLLKITSEGGVAAGVRRIEAVTGEKAFQYVQDNAATLAHISSMLKSKPEATIEKIDQVLFKNRQLEKELERLKVKMSSAEGDNLTDQAVKIGDIKLVAAKLDGADPKSLRDTVDNLKNKLGEAVVVLATVSDGRVSLVAGVTKSTSKLVKAGEVVNMVAQQVGGKGGGRPDMAQAGGSEPQNLDKALVSVKDWVIEKLK
ncbi:MAG: alanine--tRNA ligase [Gammaproteobacteria bacterium]|nr:alanine--tRNA ligase [Gammaproteobacteria bacterium]